MTQDSAAQERALQEKIAQTKEVQFKKIDAQTQAELAKIAAQKELAQIQKEQLIAKIELEAQAQKKALEAKLLQEERADAMEVKRYLLLILFFVLVMGSYFLYLYFKRRHDDKLLAYKDNLEKYFHQQENMTRLRIAEKIIDTVASGKLDKAQENELLKALNGSVDPKNKEDLLLQNKPSDQ